MCILCEYYYRVGRVGRTRDTPRHRRDADTFRCEVAQRGGGLTCSPLSWVQTRTTAPHPRGHRLRPALRSLAFVRASRGSRWTRRNPYSRSVPRDLA